MNCYFCQVDIPTPDKVSRDIFYCPDCPKQHNVSEVITTKNTFNKIEYAHIYIDKSTTYFVGSKWGFSGSGSVSVGPRYHIRLHLLQNYTVIIDANVDASQPLLTLPGLSITPANAEQKLKLYLLFS